MIKSLLIDVFVLVRVALDGVVFDEKFDALVETGAVEGDRLTAGYFRWIGRRQAHEVIRARRIGTTVAVGTIRQSIYR